MFASDMHYIAPDECLCKGGGWVPNYDVRESALLAGLTVEQALQVTDAVGIWLTELIGDPMPPEDEIRLAFLQAYVEIVGV